jgi:hypothetical protein
VAKQRCYAYVFSGTAARQHRTATSLERLSLFETAALQNAALCNKPKSIDAVEFELGRAEYVGISLPVDITRFFKVLFYQERLMQIVQVLELRLRIVVAT